MLFDALPDATRDLFEYAGHCEALAPFTLMGGTALALQIGHRQSFDLDFAVFTEKLPVVAIDDWMSELHNDGIKASHITSPAIASQFRINTGLSLQDYARDYEIAGVKVTFFTHGRHPAQREYYRHADRLVSTERSFGILGLDGLKVAKTLVLADRIRSRDLFDVMVLMRDHGLTMADMADSVTRLGHNNDFEHYTAVMTGELPLDAEDEGLTATTTPVATADIYAWLGSQVDNWQVAQARNGQNPA